MTLGPVMIDIAGTMPTEAEKRRLKHRGVCGVILFSRNFHSIEQLQALTTQLHALHRPPLLIAVDQEGGRVQRFREPFIRLPPAQVFGEAYDRDAASGLALARTCGWLMAAELRACGVDLSFAPVVDIGRGICAVIGDRACHSDPAAVAEIARAYVGGMHAAGMKATAKHFPGHGGVAADSHLTLPVDARAYPAMRADLMPFHALITTGLDAVMMALVSYPAVDEAPAAFSGIWIGEQLRGRLGFGGAVVSDDLSMAGAAGVGSMRRRVRAALSAGNDIVLICNDAEAADEALATLPEDQPVSQARRAALRGSRAPGWKSLRHGAAWRQARELISRACAECGFELDGG